MTTNSSATSIELDQFFQTQIGLDKFFQKCTDLEQECSIFEDKGRTLSNTFEDLAGEFKRSGPTYRPLKKECHMYDMSCEDLTLDLSELVNKLKVLSNNCITLGLETSNLMLNELADRAEKFKCEITNAESRIREIMHELPRKDGIDSL